MGSEAVPEGVRQAVGGGCQSGWGRLLSVTNAIEAGTWRSGRQWLGIGWAPWKAGGGGAYSPCQRACGVFPRGHPSPLQCDDGSGETDQPASSTRTNDRPPPSPGREEARSMAGDVGDVKVGSGSQAPPEAANTGRPYAGMRGGPRADER